MSLANTIVTLVKRTVRGILGGVHTHLPAQVISYDAATNLCSVQPCINRVRSADPNKTSVQLPVLEDVPVKQFGSGKCLLTIAPQVGSYGLLHVNERELATWITKGGIVDPGKHRMFDISDCFFDPGIYPTVADGDNGLVSSGIETDRIELRTRTRGAFISVVGDDDTVEINGDADFAVAFTDMETAFDQLKNDFDSLVSTYNSHIHVTTATVGAGPTVGVISPTTSTGSPSTADMSGAKIESIKVP